LARNLNKTKEKRGSKLTKYYLTDEEGNAIEINTLTINKCESVQDDIEGYDSPKDLLSTLNRQVACLEWERKKED